MNIQLLGLSCLIATAPCHASQFLFVSHAKSPEITTYNINQDTGKLSIHSVCSLEGDGGFMHFSPSGTHAYVNSSGGKDNSPHITTLSHNNGKLTTISSYSCEAKASGLHVHHTGRFLASSHYGTGKVAIWKINDKGEFTGEAIQTIQTDERAHFVVTSPDNNYLYVPHTRPNCIFQFNWDATTGNITELNPQTTAGPENTPTGHEPRHLAFHPILKLAYSSNERGGAISSWGYNPNNGQLLLGNTHSSTPPGFTGKSAASDIKLTPNGKFAYVANRAKDHGASTIASFAINSKDGSITPTGHYEIGHGSRAVHIDSTGSFLYVAATGGDELLAFRIQPDTGKLTLIERYPTQKGPFWIQSQ